MTTPSSSRSALLPRPYAIGVLMLVGVCMGANHIAARLAFDHGTAVVAALVTRSGAFTLAMAVLALWQRRATPTPWGLGRGTQGWLALLGGMIALQSFLLYSAVARIPVALSLLAFNIYPVLYALLSWALGAPRPSRRQAVLMLTILAGLALALDAPTRLRQADAGNAQFWIGVGLAVMASCVFVAMMWTIDHRVRQVPGVPRSMASMGVAFVVLAAAGAAGLLPGGLRWPGDGIGWLGLALLTLLYGSGSALLFVLMPRLDMARNASAANVEPIAALGLGWLVLGQALAPSQVVGAVLVVAGIVLLARNAGR